MLRVIVVIKEVLICSVLILLIYSGLSKLLDYGKFSDQLARSPYVEAIHGFVAWALPLGEILIALALVFEVSRRLALYLSLYLMTLFTVYIYSMLNFSYYIPCSCGGVLESLSWQQHLLFNIVFVVAIIAGIFLNDHQKKRKTA